jgi:hypothetical protein
MLYVTSTHLRHLVVVMVTRSRSRRSVPTDASSPEPGIASRWIWLLVMVLSASIVSSLAGVLSHAAGNNIPGAILTGGAAFAGTVGLLLAIAHYTRAE